MNPRLTWQDLFIETIPETSAACLKEWDFLLGGRFAIVGMSRFGDWFLRRSDGSTDELSVIEGTLQRIANTPEEFTYLMNEPQWQEEHLLSWLVLQLYQKEMIPKPDQSYGFAPHPSLLGRLDPTSAMIFSVPVWQTICAQTFSAAKK
jgi:hypothetical protein